MCKFSWNIIDMEYLKYNEYIIINKDNYKIILDGLASFGYSYGDSIKRNTRFELDNGFVNKFIVVSVRKELCLYDYDYFMTNYSFRTKELNPNMLLREYKLKRILKCC